MDIEIDLSKLIINTGIFLFFSIIDIIFNTFNIMFGLSNLGYCGNTDIFFNSIFFVISFLIIIYSSAIIVLSYKNNTSVMIICHKLVWMFNVAKITFYIIYFIVLGLIMFSSNINCFDHIKIYFVFMLISLFILPLLEPIEINVSSKTESV